jgi:hypothetical protein
VKCKILIPDRAGKSEVIVGALVQTPLGFPAGKAEVLAWALD